MADLRFLNDESPVALFVATLRMMVKTRRLMANMANPLGDKYSIFMEDLTMLLEEGVTYGCRTQWVRRVCVPMVMAQKELDKEAGTIAERAKIALEILSQLHGREDNLLATCRRWFKEALNVD